MDKFVNSLLKAVVLFGAIASIVFAVICIMGGHTQYSLFGSILGLSFTTYYDVIRIRESVEKN